MSGGAPLSLSPPHCPPALSRRHALQQALHGGVGCGRAQGLPHGRHTGACVPGAGRRRGAAQARGGERTTALTAALPSPHRPSSAPRRARPSCHASSRGADPPLLSRPAMGGQAPHRRSPPQAASSRRQAGAGGLLRLTPHQPCPHAPRPPPRPRCRHHPPTPRATRPGEGGSSQTAPGGRQQRQEPLCRRGMSPRRHPRPEQEAPPLPTCLRLRRRPLRPVPPPPRLPLLALGGVCMSGSAPPPQRQVSAPRRLLRRRPLPPPLRRQVAGRRAAMSCTALPSPPLSPLCSSSKARTGTEAAQA